MKEQKVKIKNLEINYKYYPPEFPLIGEGEFIFLILHGWGGSSDSWVNVCGCLARSYEVYALDFPFFGKSDDLKEVWKVDDYAEMVEEFVARIITSPTPSLLRRGEGVADSLSMKGIVIIAHSFGGRVAIKLAAKNHKWISKLFLCGAAGIKHPLTIKQKFAGAVARIWKNIFKTSPIPILSMKGEGVAESLLRRVFYRALGAADYYNCKNDIMRETFKKVIAEDLTEYLEKIKIPSTIILGEKDKYIPLADGKLMNEKIKNSNLHIIKGAGHGTHIYSAEEVCEIIKNNVS